MLITNARLLDKEGLWNIELEGQKIKSITQNPLLTNLNTLNADGGLVLPPFVEPHVHLDAAMTAGQPHWNESGTLFEGIERWAERKPLLSINDVKERATAALKWQIAQGIQAVRTHVDVTDPELIALKALLEVKQEMAPWIDIQIVAFPQEGINSYPKGLELMEESLRLGADVVGGIPHFEFTREYGVDSIGKIFNLAEKYGKLIDIHCDEIDDEQSRFVEVVAAEAYKREMGSLVTASHTTAMHSYNNAYTYKLFRLLKLSNINFVANPLVNIHLQGRFDTYPKRRGITRVKELLAAGLNVCFGHDDIFDPWYPLGTASMLQVLHMGLHTCQMMGYSEINDSIKLITSNSAKTLGIKNYSIEPGKPANLIIMPAQTAFDAVRLQVNVRYSIRNGQIIAETQPRKTNIFLGSNSEIVDFNM